jgi:hypothetical protein
MRCTSLVLALLVACTAERGAPPMPAPPILEGSGIAIDEDARGAIIAALSAQLAREIALRAGEVPPTFVERCAVRALPHALRSAGRRREHDRRRSG